MTHTSHSQRGSAILLVFIAIALFGALAYGLMRGSGGSMMMMGSEQSKTYANQIIAYGSDIKAAAKRLSLMGVSDTQFSFENGTFKTYDNNPLNPANPNCATEKCKIFSISGGQINAKITSTAAYTVPDPVTSSWPQGGAWQALVLNNNGVGTIAADLSIINVFVSKDVCLGINKLLGVDNPSGNPPTFTAPAFGTAVYTGQDFKTLTTYGVFGDTPSLYGKRAYCYRLNGQSTEFYNFLTVLIER